MHLLTRLWDTRVILCVLVVAVLIKRPAVSRSDIARVARAVQDLDKRMSDSESRLASVESVRAAPAVRTDDGAPRDSTSSDERRTMVTAPPDWRFAVVRGEPCVLFGSGHRFVLRAGHMSRFGRVLAVGPDSVLTDRCIVSFEYSREIHNDHGAI